MKFRCLTLSLGTLFIAPLTHAFDGSGWTVAVLDSGFNSNYPNGRFVRSSCISEKTNFFTDDRSIAGRTISKSYLFKHLSKCHNDDSITVNSGSSYAKTLPRYKQNYYFYQNVGRVERKNFTSYYSNHGTNVLHQVLKSAPGANMYPVTVGSFSASADDPDYKYIHSKNCNPVLTKTEFPVSGRDYRISYFAVNNCSPNIGYPHIITGIADIVRRSSKVVAANFSLGFVNSGTLCSKQTSSQHFQALVDKGIIPVAASGNNPNLSIHWPACLNNVVAVAQVNNGIPVYSSVTGGKIDYFAEVTGNKPTDNQFLRGTSYAAPLVSGAFATMKSANPNATVQQLKDVLHNTGTPVPGYTARIINVARAVQAIRNVPTEPTNPPTTPDPEPPTTPDPTQQPTPTGQRATLGITSDTYYANFAKFSFDLNGNAYHASSLPEKSPAKASARITDLRDIKLTFDAQLCTGKDPRTLQGVDIFVNGVRRHYFHGLRHTPSAMDCYNLGYRGLSFMLNRNWLKSGENTIEMHRRNYRDPFTLGATNIRMDYNPPETLRIDQKDPRLYGHRVGTRKHLTGLRVEFASTKDDLEFSATGFDIDSSTEIALFLNYKLIGYLTRGSSSRYNAGDVFRLEKEDFVSSGINTLEFVQTSSSDRENWGVVNMELTGVKPPAITGALMLLLGD